MHSFEFSAAVCVILSSTGAIACSGTLIDEGDPGIASVQGELKHASCGCAPLRRKRPARLIELGYLDSAPSDNHYSFASALNDRRTVVGHAIARPPNSTGDTHAVRWQPDTGLIDLGTLGGSVSSAYDVNNRDEVVGEATSLDDAHTRAVLWDARGRIHDLGTLGGDYSRADKINDRGQVVGISMNAQRQNRVFMWAARTGMVDLNFPDGRVTINGFNDSGEIVGGLVAQAKGNPMPFKWTREAGVIELDLLGGTYGTATAINDEGEIVGWIYDGATRPVRWTGDHGVRLPRLAARDEDYPLDESYSLPFAINNRGFIVGRDTTADLISIQWPSVDRVERVPLGPRESYATDVNDCGDIAGIHDAGLPEWQAFLWEPAR
jgi:probable HAF family extracellular repeat protein